MIDPPHPPRLRAVPPPREDVADGEDAAAGDGARAGRASAPAAPGDGAAPAAPADAAAPGTGGDPPRPRAALRLVPPLPPDDPPRGAA